MRPERHGFGGASARRALPGAASRAALAAAVVAVAAVATAIGSPAGGDRDAARDGRDPAQGGQAVTQGRPPVRGETTTFEAGGESVRAYLARPSAPGSFPGMVVVHEWWGLNDQIKRVADRLAAQGYEAVAPDLYRGKVAGYREADLAHELSRGLNEKRAVAIVKGAAAYIRTTEKDETLPVGVIGFCMGGGVALQAALEGGALQAAVMFYGSVETDPNTLKHLACPLLGFFGSDDRGIPPDEVRRFEAALKAAGKTATVHIYPGVGHAFFNEDRPSFDKDVALDAWANTSDFLAAHLKKK